MFVCLFVCSADQIKSQFEEMNTNGCQYLKALTFLFNIQNWNDQKWSYVGKNRQIIWHKISFVACMYDGSTNERNEVLNEKVNFGWSLIKRWKKYKYTCSK